MSLLSKIKNVVSPRVHKAVFRAANIIAYVNIITKLNIYNINTIASVYNRPMRVLFDGENIYLKSQEEKPLGELA